MMFLHSFKRKNSMKRFIPTIMIFAVLVSLSVTLWSHQSALAASTIDMTKEYKIVNHNSGLVLGISGGVATAGAAALQWTDNGTSDHLWRFITNSGTSYKIENVNSGAILGITNGSKTAGAAVVQWGDNGTGDHVWQLNATGNGTYKIVNLNSGMVMGISSGSKAVGAAAIQWTDSGANDQLWSLVAAGISYPNPIALSGNDMIRDPSMIKLANGTYYAFSTSITIPYIGLEIHSSTDRIHFVDAGPVFKTVPSWTNSYDGNTPNLWAPDISYHNGKYWLYYAASTFGSETSAIGLATSTTAAPKSWVDQGIVYTSIKGDGYNAIDPCLVIDSSGKYWLSLGSGWTGIQLIQIDPSTGKQMSSNKTRYHIADRTTSKVLEASYIYPHGGYYYLFASIDTCCNASATYHIIVGRATSITGPYTDKGGLAMLQGGGTIILSTHGNIVGPGGESVMTDAGNTVIDYQYHDANNKGLATLGINLLGWDAHGWPYVR
jgi:arabinan endo-1,5-alpha-L-arabinosidase